MEENNYFDFESEDDSEISYKPKPKIKLGNVFLFQFIVCLLILSSLGGMKYMLPQVFEQVKDDLLVANSGEEFKKGIQSICQNIIDSINKLTPITNKEESSTPPEEDAKPQGVNNSNEVISNETKEQGSDIEVSASVKSTSVKSEYILPLNGHVTSPYGERVNPITNEKDFHRGVDIGANEGEDIKSIAQGVVIEVASDEKSGNYLLVDHQNGIVSLYAHCSKINVNKGDNVQQGQVIANVGHTGEATGPHLHLGIKRSGLYINPTEIFQELK